MTSKKESSTCGGIFDLACKEARVNELEKQMEDGAFWENQERAQSIINECNELKSWTQPWRHLYQRFEDAASLVDDVLQTGDEALLEDLKLEFDRLIEKIEELEVRRMLGGPMDSKNCFVSINSGAGGTEACDWAEMLARMYQRWALRHEWQVEVVDTVPGEVAGIKNMTLRMVGDFAYGYAKAEKGVHRLVRISPFDSSARRHTSFASVDVSPEISDDIAIDIRPDQIRIDTFRASGAGGQHVNRTDSAVRITHLPSGIVVSCQAERSQVQNKETCFKLLRSKLYEKEVLEREASLRALSGEKKEIGWGSQIRNYVFQPYTLVKDARTGVEVGDVRAMMDGELLDEFIIAYLKESGGKDVTTSP